MGVFLGSVCGKAIIGILGYIYFWYIPENMCSDKNNSDLV